MSWWRRLLRKEHAERQLDSELRFHFDALVMENVRAGMSEPEARRKAHLEFGGLDQVKEECRDSWGVRWLDEALQDLRFAVRLLGKSKGLTAVLILTLALGIGANTAIFSLVNQVLLHPPGMTNPERLVAVRALAKSYANGVNVSPTVLADVRASHQIFEHAAASNPINLNYTSATGPIALMGMAVTAEWFDVFGMQPQLGRVFTPEEDRPGANLVAVLPYSTWVRLFGADASILGQTIELSQQPYKIIGVMPPSFQMPRTVDVWIPLALPEAAYAPKNRCCGTLLVVARMNPDIRFAQARAWLKVLTERAWNEGTNEANRLKNNGWTEVGVPLVDAMAGQTKPSLLLLFGAVGVVLLIVCSNLAGLMLAKTSARLQEIAVRAALGATRGRLLRQLFSESLLLSAAGALLGLAVAQGGVKLLLLLAPEGTTTTTEVPVDFRVLAFTACAAIVSCVLFALAPAFHLSNIRTSQASDALKSGTRYGMANPFRQRLRSALVVVETGLALILLVAAGLLVKTLASFERTDLGFDSHSLMSAVFALPPKQYPDGVKQTVFYRTVLDNLASVHTVKNAAISIGIPFGNWAWGLSFDIEGHPRAPGEPFFEAIRQYVTPGYFQTLEIPLRRGRFFTEADRMRSQRVAVIDEQLAHRYWPDSDPVGKRISMNSGRDWIPIVGVAGHTVGDFAGDRLGLGLIYFSLYQREGGFPFAPIGWVIARTDGKPTALAGTIREAVRRADNNQPVDQLKSLDNLISSALATRRFVLRLLEFFAVTAMFLAAMGLYGIINYSVAQRTREIGIQMAFGAPPRRVRNEVLFQGMRLALIGVVIGLAGAFGLTRLLASLLYGVQPHDPVTFTIVPVILIAVALVACYIPARRATRINPSEALRYE